MNFLPRTVYMLGAVSFLTDLSSEMIYPLLPLFLTSVLGAGAVQLGIIEGVAESTAAFLKILSGFWTDRLSKRKPFLLFGYTLSGLTRPLIGLAATWPFVLLMRFLDRVGKGLRSSPRDAMIADVTPDAVRGRAYGLHRAMDHAGAVGGPLLAMALMGVWALGLRQVFLLAIIPAILVVILLLVGVKDAPHITANPDSGRLEWRSFVSMPRDFKVLILGIFVFTLGNSTDAFLLLRLTDAGVPGSGIALLWSLHHVVKMVSTYYGGRMADKMSRRTLLILGWGYYAFIYAGFALSLKGSWLIFLFLAYGVYFGLSEPVEKALVSQLAPPDKKGTAFGIYHGTIGLAALPASLLFGFIWKLSGAPAAFLTGAVLALIGSLILLLLKRNEHQGAAA